MSVLLATENDDDNTEETSLRKALAALDVQRRSLEHEADAIVLELTTPPNEGIEPMGIDTPSVDEDGYPRGDIDLYRARTLRGRFRVLQTDHKAMLTKIATMLSQLAALKKPERQQSDREEQMVREAAKDKPAYDSDQEKWVLLAGSEGTIATWVSVPPERVGNGPAVSVPPPPPPPTAVPETIMRKGDAFARIDAVAPGSPADLAGLRENDLIVQFGPLVHLKHDLSELADLVLEQAAAKRDVPIHVLRRRSEGGVFEPLEIHLTPRPWNGRGLIGCHILPYQHSEK